MKNNRNTPKRLRSAFYIFICIFSGTAFLTAHTPDAYISSAGFELTESAFCRKELVDSWFKADPESIKTKEPQVIRNETGDCFLVRREEANGELQIIIAPLVKQKVILKTSAHADGFETDAADKPLGENNAQTEIWIETWPQDAPGSWILYRDALTGKPLRIRCYFVHNKEVYIDFFPGKDKSSADFMMFGAAAAAKVPVPLSFEQLYLTPFEEVVYITRYTLPWNYTRISLHSYDDVMQMTGMIRSLLPSVQKKFVKDKNGSIAFLKWIVDGLVKPLTGSVITPESLTIHTVESAHGANEKLRGSASPPATENFDSLNAVRNMAAAAISARTGIFYHYNNSGADVKTEAFSYYTDSSGTPHNAGFSANSGYPVEMLKPLLYVLAATEVQRFFLGAVRQYTSITDSAKNGVLRPVFSEGAAFFTWFDKQGRLQAAVFERGTEYTLDEFIQKYRGSFVFLVRVKASMEFYPDRMDKDSASDAEKNTQPDVR